MAKPRFKVADIDEASIARIKQMEESLELTILALQPHYPTAQLTEEQLAKLQVLEAELGVTLIAYKEA